MSRQGIVLLSSLALLPWASAQIGCFVPGECQQSVSLAFNVASSPNGCLQFCQVQYDHILFLVHYKCFFHYTVNNKMLTSQIPLSCRASQIAPSSPTTAHPTSATRGALAPSSSPTAAPTAPRATPPARPLSAQNLACAMEPSWIPVCRGVRMTV